MSRQIVVIMNPAARSAQAAHMLSRVRRLQPSPEIFLSERVGHAAELAEGLANEGKNVIVAMGGDGTVNEVLQGICKVNAGRRDLRDHVVLGTLPGGTMNVFAYEMGFRSHTDLATPWRVIQSGSETEIDLWMANERFFVQLAGVGVDAEIVRLTTWESKKRLGALSYFFSALRVLGKKLPIITLEIEGRPALHGSLALVGNGAHYGGPFRLFRHASLTDGRLDVLLVRERAVNAWQALQLLRGMLWDGFHKTEDLDYLQLERFAVRCEAGTAIELDGELAGTTPVVFQKAAFPLRVAAVCSAPSRAHALAGLQSALC